MLAHFRGRRAALTTAAAVAAACFLPATSASAAESPPPATGVIEGNNGTLKVHAPETPLLEDANEPQQVCAFYLAGFGFDDNQVLTYSFETQGGSGTGTTVGTGGTFTVGPANDSPAGVGRSPLLNAATIGLAPDGQYKVTVTTNDGTKSKVFQVDCPATPPGGEEPVGEEPVGEEPVGEEPAEEEPEAEGEESEGEERGVKAVRVEDDGDSPSGGVDTGGGGSATSSPDTTTPVLLGLGAVALAGVALRRRRS